ncbi:MAG: type II CRISPR RNA-guided endonuclease Cas9, partial [Robiginitomaculum sp.]|nr:type II CRISPR RNA-guided endonuclease Cas9 [Robiginitomaculum sp.]
MNIGKKFGKLNTIFEVNDNIVLGLDIGIASCGWAWLDTTAKKIIAAGTFGFETPEVAKTRESKAAVRRVFRGQRRRLRRRRNRMRDIRQLLHKNGLLSTATPPIEGQPKPAINPWQMRAKGLQKKLDGDEFASALIHIAKHRGYRSNSKSEGAQDAPSEDRKALSGLAAILEKSARYETVGEMFALDEEFASKKRNRAGEYTHTVFRHLHETEIGILFEKQRRFGSKFTDVTLEQEFATLAFDQLALGGSEDMLGRCPFEPKEFRASSLAFSFERFRFLSKLVHSRISDDSRSGRTLTREELAKAMNGFGKGAKAISWSRLVKQIGLPTGTGFVGVGDKGMKNDVARNSKGCAFGSNTLCNVLGEAAWNSLVKTPEVLDGIAHILTFQEDVDHISAKLGQLELSPSILDTLMAAVKQGKFAKFAKAGHISTKAARNILPGLLAGKVYSEACEFAGYDHTTENPAKLETMTNPVAKRAVLETLKQVNALVRHFGQRPGAVHVELGRDMGKGPKERGQIKAGMDRRTAEKSVAKAAFCQLVGKDDCSFDELQRYELWKEQMHECMFCYPRRNIEPMALRHGQHVVEIEHILPIGRSQDNSWNNKVLACATCNRNKGAKTPFEWFGDDHARWDEFNFRVKSLFGDGKIKGFKVRNLTMRDFDERAGGFIERNLNDLRYASKVILGELHHLYHPSETEGRKRLFARPGTVTGILRRLWGLQSTKYIKTGD